MTTNLINFLEKNENTRKIFGVRELKIIEKQLWGINLKQSEKNRLSRDIRKKFEFIKDICGHNFNLKLKKGSETLRITELVKEEILEHGIAKDIEAILLFGSHIKNEITFRSDIDIAVVFKKKISLKEATNFRIKISENFSEKVDIQVFNVLPEKIKKSIIKNHKVIYGNKNVLRGKV